MTASARIAPFSRALLVRATLLVVCGLLPFVALWYAIGPVAFGDRQAADFHYNYYYAAEAVRAGKDFLPSDGFVVRGENDLVVDYVYPPLLALATVPWTFVPVGLAEVLFQLLLVAAFVATLAVLGVRAVPRQLAGRSTTVSSSPL